MKYPFSWQQQVLTETKKYYLDNDNGKIILPCGAGKTLISFWAAMQHEPNIIVFITPTLTLINQSLNVFLNDIDNAADYTHIIIASDNKIAGKESTTTEVEQILPLLIERKLIIFSTYVSSPKLFKAFEISGKKADFVIYDEAHHTAGSNDNLSSKTIFANKTTYQKRLFLTATPRVLLPKFKEEQTDFEIVSMDNEEIYGKTIFTLSVEDAIEQNIICDYKIIATQITTDELLRILTNNIFIKNINLDQIVKTTFLFQAIALHKTIQKQSLKKIITFNNTISTTNQFKHALELVNTIFNTKYIIHSLNGYSNHETRTNIIADFTKIDDSIQILCNARLLGEGFDVPNVDAVCFAEQRTSVIDIVQACGRAWRKSANKTYGYIILPLGKEVDNLESINQVTNSIALFDNRIFNATKGRSVKNIPQFDFSDVKYIDAINYIDEIRIRVLSPLRFWDVDTAKEWVQANLVPLGINTNSKYNRWTKGKYPKAPLQPKELPTYWFQKYKISSSEFYGISNAQTQEFWDLKTAKDWVRNNLIPLGINNKVKYLKWLKGEYPYAPRKPDQLPVGIRYQYKINFSDFLDIESVYSIGGYWDVDTAKEWVQTNLVPLGINTWREIERWIKGEYPDAPPKPKKFPRYPKSKYDNITVQYFFDKLGRNNREIWDRETAINWVQSNLVPLGINNTYKLDKWFKGEYPNAPIPPTQLPKGWHVKYKLSSYELFGKPEPHQYWDLETSKAWVQENLIPIGIYKNKTYKKWANGEIPNTPAKPINLPIYYANIYKINSEQFFGIKLPLGNTKYWDLQTAKDWIQTNLVPLGIDSLKKYKNWINGEYPNAPSKPEQLPININNNYKVTANTVFSILEK